MTSIQDKIGIEQLTGPIESPSDDVEYIAWKEAKIRTAVKQAEDRSVMTPAEQVWEKFGFER